MAERHAIRCQVIACFCCVVVLAGCGEQQPDSAESCEPSQLPGPTPSAQFDPSACGSIEGHVTWDGPIPVVPSFQVHSSGVPNKSHMLQQVRLNPNAIEVDPRSRGVHLAIVRLRGVDPAKARPWDYEPISIEMRRHWFNLFEGDKPASIGFVKRGAEVAIYSSDEFFHCVCARGAAAFSLPFVDPGRKTTRRLDRPGLVELTSGASYYWMRAYLFVDDHPYYARSDRSGAFRMGQVPPGRYKIACWHPNWQVIRQERDPESSLISRVVFAPPLEVEQEVVVEPRKAAAVQFTLRSPGPRIEYNGHSGNER